jgi:hypothetical protein
MAWYNPFSWGKDIAEDILDKDNGLVAQAGAWIGNQNYTDQEKPTISNPLERVVM